MAISEDALVDPMCARRSPNSKTRRQGAEASLLSLVLFGIGLFCPLGVVLAAPTTTVPSSKCEPVRIGSLSEPIGDPWQAALDDLVRAASGTTRPWDCSGGELWITSETVGVTLHVRLRDGRLVARPVPSPDLLKPTGEAVLAAPNSTPRAPSPPENEEAHTARPSYATPPDPAALAASPTPRPRLMFDVGASARYTHPPNILWAGGSFRVTVPFGPWSGAAWARFALPADVLDRVPSDFSITEVSIGVAFGRRILESPVELRISLDTSAAVVSMEGGDGPAVADGSRTDFRLGPDLQATWPFARIGRYFLGTDFEIGPADLGHARRIRPTLPPLPAFTTGLSTGIGLGIL